MEYREVIIEDYDLKANILVVPEAETAAYLSQIELNPDGGGIHKRDYEAFLVTSLVGNYEEFVKEVGDEGNDPDMPYLKWGLARAIYSVNDRLEPTQVLVRGEKCMSRHDLGLRSETDEPTVALTGMVDWHGHKPNLALATAWSAKYLHRFKAGHATDLQKYEIKPIEEFSIELPVLKVEAPFNVLWGFVCARHSYNMDHAKLDFSGWMQYVVEITIWRHREVENMLLDADFSKRSAFAIRLKLYDAVVTINPKLAWPHLDWDNAILGLVCGVTPSSAETPALAKPGIPESPIDLDSMDPVLLQELEVRLKEKIKGQPHAIKILADAIQTASLGFGRKQQRPIGTFLFAGPTGVGKTETAKALAECLMGGNLITENCAEYQEAHEIAKLFGAPPGYAGFEDKRDSSGEPPTTLASRIKKTPSSVVLFDEIEKAHTSLFHALLRVIDEGVMTSGRGEDVSFKDAVIIMTSNIGVRAALGAFETKTLGFTGNQQQKDYKTLQATIIQKAIEATFPLEFQARLSAVIVFNPLDPEASKEIVSGLLHETQKTLKDLHNITLAWTDEVVETVVGHGFSEEFGCRDLQRAIRDLIELPITKLILESRVAADEEKEDRSGRGESLRGSRIEMAVEDGEIRFKSITRTKS